MSELSKFIHAREEMVKAAKDRGQLNRKVHVYAVDSRLLQQDLLISEKTINKIRLAVRNYGNEWKANGIGGFDSYGQFLVMAYIKGDKDIFNSVELNNLHDEVNRLIYQEKEQKTDKDIKNERDDKIKPPNYTQKGHFYSSAIVEGARLKGNEPGFDSTGQSIFEKFSATKTGYNTSRENLYVELEHSMFLFFKQQRNIKQYKSTLNLKFIKEYNERNADLKGEFLVFIHPQSKELNRAWSTTEGTFVKSLRRNINIALDNITRNISNIRSSRSFIGILQKIFDNKFFRKITGSIKSKIESRDIIKYKENIKVEKVDIAGRDYKPPTTPSLNLKEILNLRMHDHLRDYVMGDGSQKEILNYRTGRFAHSAYVYNVIQNRKDSAVVFYTYMLYPYQVFEYPKGRLSKPFRDPRYLIDRSIREIAREAVNSRFGITTERN